VPDTVTKKVVGVFVRFSMRRFTYSHQPSNVAAAGRLTLGVGTREDCA
jgi:hypothetical protein